MFDDGSYRRRKKRYKKGDNPEQTVEEDGSNQERRDLAHCHLNMAMGQVEGLNSLAATATRITGNASHTSPGFIQSASSYPGIHRSFDGSCYPFIAAQAAFPQGAAQLTAADIPVTLTSPLIPAYGQQPILISPQQQQQHTPTQTAFSDENSTSIQANGSHYSAQFPVSSPVPATQNSWSPAIPQLSSRIASNCTITTCTPHVIEGPTMAKSAAASSQEEASNLRRSESSSSEGSSPHSCTAENFGYFQNSKESEGHKSESGITLSDLDKCELDEEELAVHIPSISQELEEKQ